MKALSFFTRLLSALALIGLVLAAYFLWARPYQLRWGATDEEIRRSMPGDELNTRPTFLATRAITINGTPEEIWPWLLQMGYGRAGFYGYDIFENIGSPRGIRSAEGILPEFQHFVLGDEVPISPAGGLEFRAIEPNRYLIWGGEPGWGGITWALYPIDETHTRLVFRARISYSWKQPVQLFYDLLTEFTDHVAVRKILQGVKGRVEGHIEPMSRANLEFALYVAAAFLFFAAIIRLLIHPFSWARWLSGLATGTGWLMIWYTPISIWAAALILICILYILWQPANKRSVK